MARRIHSLTHTSLTHSRTHPLVYSFSHSFAHSHTRYARPFTHSPICSLARSAVCKVILIVRKSAAKDLRLGIEKHSVSVEIDLVTIPDESDMGTVESLRLIKDKIFTDFIVMSAGNGVHHSLQALG
jgi:hypothetical protein